MDVTDSRPFLNLKKNIMEELDVIKDIIINTIPVEKIYLFGSYAYGTPKDDSDLDIYVVMKNEAEFLPLDAMKMIGRAIRNYKKKEIDILVLKKQRFEYRCGAPTLEREVAEKGVVLYG
jgi:predicted nucleotidyltransferase